MDSKQLSTEPTDGERARKEIRKYDKELATLNDYNKVMSTDAGRRVILSIIKDCEPLDREHQKNNGQNSFAMGVKSVGLKVLKLVTESGHSIQTNEIDNNLNIDRIRELELKKNKKLMEV